MLNIFLNGESHELHSDATVLELLESAGYAGRKIAVEINREIVPKSLHGERELRDGDRVEVVHALGGG